MPFRWGKERLQWGDFWSRFFKLCTVARCADDTALDVFERALDKFMEERSVNGC